MTLRALGSTGLQVNRLGLGTVKLGRNRAVKYPTPFQLPTDAEVDALLEYALANGVNLFDTAPAYGTSESRLAPFVARHRDEIVLCTKAGEEFDGEHSRHDFSFAAITASAERSLRRLGTDHLDILLLHANERDAEILEQTDAVRALDHLKQAGKVRATGISARSPGAIVLAAELLDVVMAPFSIASPALGPALAAAHAGGKGVLAIKTLASGSLPPAEAIEFVLSQPFIDAAILGTINPAHLAEALRSANL